VLNDLLRRQRLPNFTNPLMRAALSADLAEIKRLTEEHALSGPLEGSLPLIAVIRGQHAARLRAIEWLAANGADLNQTDLAGDTALHHACYLGDQQGADLLLTLHASVISINNDQHSPVAAAAAMGHWKLVAVLAKTGAEINPEHGMAPLHAAASSQRDDAEGVEFLIEAGADVNARGKLGRTALMGAAMVGNADIADALLQRGAKINLRDDFGNTALMEAARCGANAVLERFVFWHPETEHRDKPGRTALLVAIASRRADEDTVRRLMAMGANPEVDNREGRSAVELAVGNGRYRIARVLGADAGLAKEVEVGSGEQILETAEEPTTEQLPTKPTETPDDQTSSQTDLAWPSGELVAAEPTAGEPVVTELATPSADLPEPERLQPPWMPEQTADPDALESRSNQRPDERIQTVVDESGPSDADPNNADPNNVVSLAAEVARRESAGDLDTQDPVEVGDADDVADADSGPAELISAQEVKAQAIQHAEEFQSETLSSSEVPVDPKVAIELAQESPSADEQPAAAEPLDPDGFLDAIESADFDDLEQLQTQFSTPPSDELATAGLLKALAITRNSVAEWLLDSEVDINATNDQGHTPLALAFAQDTPDLDLIEALLKQQAQADFDPPVLHTLLQRCTGSSETEAQLCRVINKLSERGAKVDASDEHQRSPLHLAAKTHSAAVAQVLLHKGADPNALDQQNRSPLLTAVAGDSPHRFGVIRQLVRSGADPHLANRSGDTAIAVALDSGDQNLLKMLMMAEQPAPVAANAKIEDPDSALIEAAADGNLGRVKRLLGRELNINARDNNGCTALLRATGANHPTIVSTLLTAGANPAVPSDNGMTPLGVAVLGNHRESVRLLLDAQVEVDQRQQLELTPLMLAAAQWNARMVGLLMRAGADVNAADETGGTALMAAVQNAQLQSETEAAATTLRNLLDGGSSVVAKNDEGHNCLHLLLGVRADDLTQADPGTVQRLLHQLIEAGAEIDHQDLAGWSPLHACAAHGLVEPARELLTAGANRRARDINGLLASDLAAERGHHSLVELFRQST